MIIARTFHKQISIPLPKIHEKPRCDQYMFNLVEIEMGFLHSELSQLKS
jgi:hypothetical protein